jgi:hypothetical protein
VVAFLPQGVTQIRWRKRHGVAWHGMANQTEHLFFVKYWEVIADNLSKAG